MRHPCRWIAGIAVAATVLAAGLTLRFGPALAFSLALAAPGAEPWLAPLASEWTREEIRLSVDGRSLDADLYRPTKPRGALLLVHGLSLAGRRHPDLERLARLLARQGQLVLVPHFEGLAAFRLSGREVAEIRAAIEHLRRTSQSVGIAGFSFGAGPALLAAADTPGLGVVGSFGGYADLRNVITFVTTGVHTWQGRRYVERQEEYNRWKLLALLGGFVDDARDRRQLEELVTRKLANPLADTRALESTLGAEGRAVLTLVVNRREEAVPALLAALPADARDALARLSPLTVLPGFRARLLIAHGIGDDSIPFTESRRLAAAVPTPARLVLFHTFHHTGPRPAWRSLTERAQDGWHLLGLADELLSQR
ncbi:MAG: hypothetical protein AUH29_05575 [Candidatus Rokubacteria bacterium 13_1_40CM_69_27]|nr:MAG: hypothetical protein AUH29_05575 [Candidatus Rokubacteria bacterium 13_1_40CM_69_27]OLC32467.1 MAG: hypothetical protein AUH81_16115 [Candidatus Rokubacteria bacterium 13_1_40CM_4_69_5]OLE39154.1 MAG: hypothetical protein AUG00_03255 [Candidatus Rokubacteria bacterium 13_1_20CM_2_70_7]